MSENKVNGKVTKRPAGYDSFDYSKRTTTKNTQLQHGKGKEGFQAPQHNRIVVDPIYRAIYEWKEHRKPLEGVVRIKVQPNREMKNKEEMTH